jgi:signal transduction histidine kinase
MKLGIEDYLVKEEITTPVLPRTILSVIERKKLRDQLTALEITQNRLQAIQEFVIRITQEIRLPLDRMRANVEEVLKHHDQDSLTNYLVIIRDNLQRVEKKLVRLKEMKTDKTVTYVKDIKMFDLSDGE